jgi:transposase
MIFISSLKYNPNETPILIEKILKDKQGMEDLYKSILSTKDIDSAMGRLVSLVQAYKDPKESIATHLFKLKVIMGKQYNENCTVASKLIRNAPSE